MEIISVAVSAYGDNIACLNVSLGKGEVIKKGSIIEIEQMDKTTVQREVVLINPRYYDDFAEISPMVADQLKKKGAAKSTAGDLQAVGECHAELIVLDVDVREVKTEENIRAQEALEEIQNHICITPYIELNMGDLSIYDYVEEGYSVPNRVLIYLQTTNPFTMALGIYEHPFKKGMSLLGPYTYTDGKFFWDRDTWKYVVKYGLKLPQDFLDHVMSDAGKEFLERFVKEHDSWQSQIARLKKEKNILCLLPENAGDVSLDDF